MMKASRNILFLAIAATLLGGCKVGLDDSKPDDKIVENMPVEMAMSFSATQMEVQTRADMGQTKEEEITSLAIFVFDANGSVVSQTIHEKAGVHSSGTGDILRPNGTDKINIETFSGYDREIFVIANYHSNMIEGLRSMATRAEVDRLVVQMLGNPVFREFGLCKIGHVTGQTITNNSVVNIPLTYISAKVTIKVINKCTDLNLSGWTVDGVPMKSYALQRTKNNDPNYHDAVDIREVGDFYYDFNDQNFAFEKLPSNPGFGDAAGKEYSTTFYMYENRRGNRAARSLPDGWTGTNPTTDFKLKSWFAPENATRIRVFGNTTLNGNPKSFLLNHYLGADNYGDYNINRGTHYTFTITINGLNDINIDTNVEQADLHLEVRPPADLTGIDAHVASRPFLLYTNMITDPNVSVTAEVLESAGSDNSPDWLDLTTVSITNQHVRLNSNPDIALWQQDGEDNTYIRAKFIPNKATRAKLTNYVAPVTLGTEDYPLDDTELPYEKSHYRLTKKITNIATAANTASITSPITLFLYVNEYPYSNSATYREAVVRFTVSRPGQEPFYTTFNVRQYPPYAFTAAPDGSNDVLIVERTEEYEHTTHSTIPMVLQMNSGMQWGKYVLPNATDNTNGFNNTLYGVYKDITGNYFEGTNYVSPKYGSLAEGWSGSDFGKIAEGAGVTIKTIGAPYTNIPTVDNPNALNNNYNISAARYCHEKNTDLNGDGNIDASETFWYLPAIAETQLFWTYRDVIKLKSDFYWSSTQMDSEKAYAISIIHETSAPHLIYNGIAQGLKKEFVNTIGPARVRCVRRIDKASVAAVAPVVVHRADGTSIVDCSNMPNSMYTTTSKNGLLQANPGLLHSANKQVYKKLEVQATKNDVSNYNQLHFGNGKCDLTKGWRLPTQREMLMIFSVRNELESVAGFAKFEDEKYWTMYRDMHAHFIVDFKTGLSVQGAFFDPTNQFNYRCVREQL